MQILKRGAEAILYKNEQGELVKERIKKSYRLEQIDKKLRTERTRAEARLINEASRAGVAVPKIFDVNVEEMKIVMEFICGERLKEVFNSKIAQEEKGKLAEEIGKSVGKLHSHNLVHGDLTTSNLILFNKKILFIDFGLGFQSKREEDFATDLSVLKEALKSTHFKDLNALWEKILAGYKVSFEGWKNVFKALNNIELRGRYVERIG